MYMKRLLFIIVVIASLGVPRVNAQLLAVKNNVLADVAMAPNLSIEVVTGGKTSLSATVIGAVSFYGKDVQVIGVMPEFRYWFNGRPLTREFIGISGAVAEYDITWTNQRYKGDAYAGAITFGYDFLLSPHWSLECHAGIGLLYYDQQRYYLGDRVRDNYYNANGFHIIPYNIGVTFAWIIK